MLINIFDEEVEMFNTNYVPSKEEIEAAKKSLKENGIQMSEEQIIERLTELENGPIDGHPYPNV